MTIQEIRAKAAEQLRDSALRNFPKQLRTACLDADLIISHILQKDRTWLLFHRDEIVQEENAEEIFSCIDKRKTGLPVAYIVGHKEFFGIDFLVTPDVLIPKPDTELLVENAISEAKSRDAPKICDMCSGSGCVGISVMKNVPQASMTFADISEKALEITRENAGRILGAEIPQKNISFVLSDLFSLVDGQFDIIVTNPPYVPYKDAIELLKDGRSEPLLALDGDAQGAKSGSNDGLFLIRKLVPQCFSHLVSGGVLLMETGEYNAEETSLLFEKSGFTKVRIEKDMNGMLRNVIGYKK